MAGWNGASTHWQGSFSETSPQRIVRETIITGEVIEDYPQDRPFPSCLILAWIECKPYHVVASVDATANIAYVITAYEPSLDRFEPDFRTRR